MNILVIHVVDLDDSHKSVNGVADSVDNAQRIINEYFGEHIEELFTDIRDSNLEWSKVISTESFQKGKRDWHTVTLEWFELNKA